MNCPKCGTPAGKNGKTETKQKYRCRACKHNFERPFNYTEPEPVEQAVGLTEAQLRAKYDLKYIISTKCEQLKKGIFMPQSEFIQFCGIRTGMRYRDILELPKYNGYHGRANDGVIFWSHPETIEKFKSEGVLT